MPDPVLCFYHNDCPDGFTAAWAMSRGLDRATEYRGVDHGDPLPDDVDGRDVVILDFSWKRPVLEELSRRCRSLLILDHHKSAQADLAGFGVTGTLRDLRTLWDTVLDGSGQDKVLVHFDMAESGATLAAGFFDPPSLAREIVAFVRDQDLWLWELEDSAEINAWINATPMSFENWDRLANTIGQDRERAIEYGAVIRAKSELDIERTLPHVTREMVIGGHLVSVANLPHFMASHAGDILGKDAPFGASYFDGPTGRKFSLRSRGGLDVSEIARSYGGGGHAAAAGFQMPRGWEGEMTPEKWRALQDKTSPEP